jgi:hypothetical protein
MVKLRSELSIDDLVSITNALRMLRPHEKSLVCLGVEVPRQNDKNVVFHVVSDKKDGRREESIIMVSADLLLEMFGGSGHVAKRNF